MLQRLQNNGGTDPASERRRRWRRGDERIDARGAEEGEGEEQIKTRGWESKGRGRRDDVRSVNKEEDSQSGEEAG